MELKGAINELHNKAMVLADEAFYAKKQNDLEIAQSKYLKAYEYEKAAALLLVNEYSQEPSRSVLFRSAASLLLNLPYPKEAFIRKAEQMVAFGLSGNPPKEIAEEITPSLARVNVTIQTKSGLRLLRIFPNLQSN